MDCDEVLEWLRIEKIAQERWPNLFADYTVEMIDNLPYYKTKFQKV